MGGSNIMTMGCVPDPGNDLILGASVSLAATGTVIGGVANKRVAVFAAHLLAAASVTLQVQDVSAGGTVNLTGAMTLLAGQPLVLPFGSYPWYTVAAGDSLVFALGANIQVSGRLIFMQG